MRMKENRSGAPEWSKRTGRSGGAIMDARSRRKVTGGGSGGGGRSIDEPERRSTMEGKKRKKKERGRRKKKVLVGEREATPTAADQVKTLICLQKLSVMLSHMAFKSDPFKPISLWS